MKLEKKYWIAIFCRGCVILTTFLITVFLNRGLGVSNKGEYSYIIHLVEILYVLLSFGIGQAYSTFKRTKGENVRGIFVALGLLHGVLILIIGGGIVSVFRPEYGYVVVALTALAVVKVVISMIAVIEESIKRNLIETVINIIYMLVLAILYFTKSCSLQMVLICYALNDIVRILILMKSYGMKPKVKEMRLCLIGDIYKTGFVTMIVMLLISINYSIDTVMLKYLSESSHVGIYSVAINFSNMFLLIPDAFKEVLFGDSTRKDFSKNVAINSIKVSLMTSMIILCAFAFLGQWAIKLFYGEEYLASYGLTLIIFIGSLSMIFFKILQPVYIAYGKQYRAMIFLSISALMNIIVNVILIPRYDSLGAAIASAISYTICGGLFIIDYVKNFDKGEECND